MATKTQANGSPKKGGRIKTTGERPEGKGRDIVYPNLQLVVCCSGEPKVELQVRPALTGQKAKELLDLESEPEYIARMMKADPTLKEENCQFPDVGKQVVAKDEDGNERTATVLFKDENDKKVVCWNVTGNRPFDEITCGKYIQDTLNRNWAGPSTGEESFNGETIVIGATGRVESGQHRLPALYRAWQRWLKDINANAEKSYWGKLWPKEQYPDGPVMDVPIWFGISESPKVVRTLDLGRPRTTSDTISTCPLFKDLKEEYKRECSKMMDSAVDLLWARTGAAKLSTRHKYATAPELMDMIDRHSRLKNAVLHLHKVNRQKAISLLFLSAGEMATVMYLQAVGASDENAYRNTEPMPKESALDFSLWDKAEKFWREISDGEALHDSIKLGIAAAADADEKATKSFKLAVVAKAWAAYLTGTAVTPGDCTLGPDDIKTDTTGRKSVALPFHFNADDDQGGIDQGQPVKGVTTKEDVDEEKAAIDKEKAEAHKAKIDEAQKKIEAMRNKKKGDDGLNGAESEKLSSVDSKLAAARKKLEEKKAAAATPAAG
jgi:hypothetical protein